jgi:hypothetical protein
MSINSKGRRACRSVSRYARRDMCVHSLLNPVPRGGSVNTMSAALQDRCRGIGVAGDNEEPPIGRFAQQAGAMVQIPQAAIVPNDRAFAAGHDAAAPHMLGNIEP